MIGRFRSSNRASNRPSDRAADHTAARRAGAIGAATHEVALAEIDVMRIDATLRALPDHDDRPDGPSISIDRSLMAAASIQASINRQRRRAVETPAAPAPSNGLTWLASMAVFAIALVVLGLAWEVGEKAYYDTPGSATLTVATEADQTPPAEPRAMASSVTPASATASSATASSATASTAMAPSAKTLTTAATAATTVASVAQARASAAVPAVASIEGRRVLHTRERPTARHFPASDKPLIIPDGSTPAATDADAPKAPNASNAPFTSPAWQAWTRGPNNLH